MAANDDQRKIEVELPGGAKKSVRFTSLTLVPMGLVRRTRNDRTEQLWSILEWAVHSDDWAIVDELPTSQLVDLLTRMQEISEVSMGESEASSKPSTSTARRSKQTSSTKD
jgi:hypothetical protein